MIQVLHFLSRKWDSGGPTIVFALHPWLISIFSKTTEANKFKVYQLVALDSVYISTTNDVTSCNVNRTYIARKTKAWATNQRRFWSADNRANVWILRYVRVAFLSNHSTDFENVDSFGTGDSGVLFPRHCRFITNDNAFHTAQLIPGPSCLWCHITADFHNFLWNAWVIKFKG